MIPNACSPAIATSAKGPGAMADYAHNYVHDKQKRLHACLEVIYTSNRATSSGWTRRSDSTAPMALPMKSTTEVDELELVDLSW